MPTFRYTATDADGQPVLGTLDASGIDEARSELIGKGLRIESLADQTFEKISSQQAKDVGQYIADLTQSSLPVSEGLRQLSYELAAQSMWPSKTARILTSIADRLDAGESLTDVMTAYKTPRDLHAIITAGTKTGRTPEAVGEYTAYAQAVDTTSRFASISMTYPLIVVMAVMGVGGFAFGVVIPQFKRIFMDFGIELPAITQIVLQISDFFQPLFQPFSDSLITLLIAIAAFVAMLFSLPWIFWKLLSISRGMKRIRNRLPIIGRVFQWSSMAKFLHLIAVLINQNVPLPDALRYAGAGSDDPDIDDVCHDMAQQIDAGERPSLLRKLDGFPTGFLQLLTSEADKEGIPEAMHSVANMYESRMRMQSAVISAIMEPFVLVFCIGLPVGTIVVALFFPLIKLLNDLS